MQCSMAEKVTGTFMNFFGMYPKCRNDAVMTGLLQDFVSRRT
jgi:hypothetical protein